MLVNYKQVITYFTSGKILIGEFRKMGESHECAIWLQLCSCVDVTKSLKIKTNSCRSKSNTHLV